MKNISYRNILLCAMAILFVLLNVYCGAVKHDLMESVAVTSIFVLSIAGSVGIRQASILIQNRRRK